ncbi:uncharacterized protein LOC109861057 [Pseudomyrmex gracilis]|uniref:uncharacterized protein LOC109861057 n=1 Tax=Pseudomyrmex gracilis TaxID=219809 RepID=UPI000995ABC3|nr:uncharacterized protein LOC109861057 [Pseudomyrmex gracilis]
MDRVLQINVNHSGPAQALALQVLRKERAGVLAIAEPHRVPDSPAWAGDLDNRAAVTWFTRPGNRPMRGVLERGHGFVAVRWGRVALFACYFPPSMYAVDFREGLGAFADSIRWVGGDSVLVLGDFNAKSSTWGCPRTDRRSHEVDRWAVELGLYVLNAGRAPTCVRPQGTSIVDLSWGSASVLPLVRGWRVLARSESLSDYRYITFGVAGGRGGRGSESSTGNVPSLEDQRVGPQPV